MATIESWMAAADLRFEPADAAKANNQPDVWASQQTTLIRYTAEDFKALAPGEFLYVDLNDPNTAYSVNYETAADLDWSASWCFEALSSTCSVRSCPHR